MGKISPLTIAVIIVILAIIIPVSIMIAKIGITGKAVSEETAPQEPFNFPVKNLIFAVLLTITIIAIIFTAKRISSLHRPPPAESEYSPELKQAQSRANVKNILNNYIESALEKEKSKKEIIKDLVSAGWPKKYVKKYVEYYSKNF